MMDSVCRSAPWSDRGWSGSGPASRAPVCLSVNTTSLRLVGRGGGTPDQECHDRAERTGPITDSDGAPGRPAIPPLWSPTMDMSVRRDEGWGTPRSTSGAACIPRPSRPRPRPAPSSPPSRRAPHPLRRLGADEITAARALLTESGMVTPTTRFAYLALEEPAKAEVLAFRPGDPVDRRVRARPARRRDRPHPRRGRLADPAAGRPRGRGGHRHRRPGADPAGGADRRRRDRQGRRRLVRGDGAARHHRPRPGAPVPALGGRLRPARASGAAGCCACSRSCSTARTTTAGPTPSTASSRTWMWSPAAWSSSSTTRCCRCPRRRATSTTRPTSARSARR